MVEVNGELLLKHIDSLKTDIANVQHNAEYEGHEVAAAKNWGEDLEKKFVEFLLANDQRFDINKKQAELDLLQQFVKEVPDVEPVSEDAEVQI